MFKDCAISSNLCPAFSMQNISTPQKGIRWDKAHVFSQTVLLSSGVAFAFFMQMPLFFIGIAGYASVHMLLHFEMDKRTYFPFLDHVRITWKRLMFLTHSVFVLSGIAFAFFMQLTPIMLGLTLYGIGQTILYAHEEKCINFSLLNRINIRWHKVQSVVNILLYVSGISAIYLLKIPFIIFGLLGFAINHNIFHEISHSLSKRVQIHWDKVLLVENVATLLSGIAFAFFMRLPMVMLLLSGYGVVQMVLFRLAHRNQSNLAYKLLPEKQESSQELQGIKLANQKKISIEEEQLEEKIKVLQQQQQQGQQDQESITKKIQELRLEKINLKKDCKELKRRRESEKQNIEEVTAHRQRLTEQSGQVIQLHNDKIHALKEEEARLRKELQYLAYEMQLLEVEKYLQETYQKEVKQNIQNLKESQKALKTKERSNLSKIGKEANLEVLGSNQNLLLLEEKMQHFILTLSNQMDGLNQQMQQMNQGLSAFESKKQEMEALQENRAQLKTEIENLKNSKDLLKQKVQVFQKEEKIQLIQAAKIEEHNKQLEEKTKEYGEKCQELKNEAEKLQKIAENFNSKLEEQKSENLKKFADEIKALISVQGEQLNKNIEEKNKELQKLHEEITVAKQRIENLTEQEGNLKNTTLLEKKEQENLRKQVQNLKNKENILIEKIRADTEKSSELFEKLSLGEQNYEQQYQIMGAHLNRLKKEKAGLEEFVEEYKDFTVEKAEGLSHLVKVMSEFIEEIKNQLEQCGNMSKEIKREYGELKSQMNVNINASVSPEERSLKEYNDTAKDLLNRTRSRSLSKFQSLEMTKEKEKEKATRALKRRSLTISLNKASLNALKESNKIVNTQVNEQFLKKSQENEQSGQLSRLQESNPESKTQSNEEIDPQIESSQKKSEQMQEETKQPFEKKMSVIGTIDAESLQGEIAQQGFFVGKASNSEIITLANKPESNKNG